MLKNPPSYAYRIERIWKKVRVKEKYRRGRKTLHRFKTVRREFIQLIRRPLRRTYETQGRYKIPSGWEPYGQAKIILSFRPIEFKLLFDSKRAKVSLSDGYLMGRHYDGIAVQAAQYIRKRKCRVAVVRLKIYGWYDGKMSSLITYFRFSKSNPGYQQMANDGQRDEFIARAITATLIHRVHRVKASFSPEKRRDEKTRAFKRFRPNRLTIHAKCLDK